MIMLDLVDLMREEAWDLTIITQQPRRPPQHHHPHLLHLLLHSRHMEVMVKGQEVVLTVLLVVLESLLTADLQVLTDDNNSSIRRLPLNHHQIKSSWVEEGQVSMILPPLQHQRRCTLLEDQHPGLMGL